MSFVEPKPIPEESLMTSSSPRVNITEREAFSIPGFLALAIAIALGLGALILFGSGLQLPAILVGVVAIAMASSLTYTSPGQTRVVQFFGEYKGTLRKSGLRMVMPLTTHTRVSVKVQNFETNELKVNDADGNPVTIAAIIVWQVADTAKAIFAAEQYQNFIAVQAESALRHIASVHPYDNADDGEMSLRGSVDAVANELAREVATRVSIAGLEVIEARISSLAYAPEIAQAMLQRQQAAAIIAAREQIVEGAVTMVEGALKRLEDNDVVRLDDERKAAMVSNLLVVLCGESRATPVVNAGSLYN
ncbi:MAG: SPFH domain-containing protein [Propionibacteriaceae bacterium]